MRFFLFKIQFLFIILLMCLSINAQKKSNIDSDEVIKETLYKKYKQEVLNYSFKDFDSLFLGFLSKNNDPKIILTKVEFYTYTIKIALFSERQAKLYKSKRKEALTNSLEYKSRTYKDYLKKTN